MTLVRFRRNLLLFALAPLPAAGCAHEERLVAASGRRVAAEGTVMTRQGDEYSMVVHVSVKHLAPPYNLASDAKAYVVWMQARDAPIENAGVLVLDETSVGELDFVTPHKVFRVSVTPESSPTCARPQNRPIFTASVDAR